MRELFGDLDYVKVFLDDILVHSKSIEEHYNHLKNILSIFKENNISINIDKSNFLKTSVVYLGNVISKDGVKADPEKIKGFKKLKEKPKTLKQLRSLIGMLNWFRPYLQNLSSRICSITQKLQKNKLKDWSQEDTKSYNSIIESIGENVLLSHPNFSESFELYTDASDTGIGAVLVQQNKLIGIYSHKLTKSETNYSVVEKECYATIKGLLHFKTIIYNTHVIIHTDSLNIIYQKEILNNRYQRWKLVLEEYDYEFRHIKGKENNSADYGWGPLCPPG
jgi:hypothetical protein